MSGIAGFVTASGALPHAKLLDDLFAAIAHRGRDGEGRFVKGGVGLVHARLAIVDLKGGQQPLLGPNGEVFVALENLGDRRYAVRPGYPLPGRSGQLGVLVGL